MLSQLIILAVLIFLNAFFAASEIAFISLNDTKIEKQAKDAKQVFSNYTNRNYFSRIFIKCICIRYICWKTSADIISMYAIS